MTTQFATSADGVRIAYETAGEGPPLILLHGGGQSRRHWFDHGYVEALKGRRRLIAIDARGHGESDKPTQRTDYAIDQVISGVLAVADACGAERFDLIGYSYGGNIGRYLAARTGRIDRFVLIGIGFGAGVPADRRNGIEGTLAQWAPVLGPNPDPSRLSTNLRAAWEEGAVRPTLAWFGALLDWPVVEPRDLGCPTLWLVGGRNEVGALESLAQHRPTLPANMRAEVIEGLDHAAELTASAKVLPLIEAFLA